MISADPSGPSVSDQEAQTPGVETLVITVRNGTEAEVELEGTFGPATPFEIIDEAGEQAPVELLLPPHTCACPCDELAEGQTCPCDHAGEPLRLAPEQTHVVRWGGGVRTQRTRAGSGCYEAVMPVTGRYRLRVCDDRDRACATATVEFPLRSPTLELTLRSVEQAVPTCRDRATLERAVRVAKAAAWLEGAPKTAFIGCEASGATCGKREARARRTTGCSVHVSPRQDVHEVTILPASVAGAPREIEVWVDGEAIAAGRVDVAGSRWGVSSEGEVRVVGVPGRTSHTHGGSPSQVGSATFEVINTGPPMSLTVRGLKWSTTYSCEPPGRDGDPVALRSVERKGPVAGRDPDTVKIGRGTTTIVVGFESQSAYQSHCNRFAVVAELEAGGERLEASAEVHVSRRTPLRR